MGLRFSHIAVAAIKAAEAAVLAIKPELLPVDAAVRRVVRVAKASSKGKPKRKAKAVRAPKQQ